MSSFSEKPQPHLLRLFIKSFRNVAENEFTFGEGHHLLVGPNGHGKTNCLEAIAMACSLRPMQPLQNIDLVKFDEPQAKILASFSGRNELEIDIFSSGKKARLNQQQLRNTSELAKVISLVSFIPAELTMITGSGSLRRRALDQAAASLFFEHLVLLRSYEKILLHRNRLLKDWPVDKNMLATFTTMLITEGANIIFFRLKAIEHLQDIFADKITAILGINHTGAISYLQKDQVIKNYAIGDILAMLADAKRHVETVELKRRVTLFGPHLDDMAFTINGINAKKSASRGQSRAIILAFKLAQMLAIQQMRGYAPIIILDDIVSELDAINKINLIEAVKHLNAQAFFSTTDVATFGGYISGDQVYHINHGSSKSFS